MSVLSAKRYGVTEEISLFSITVHSLIILTSRRFYEDQMQELVTENEKLKLENEELKQQIKDLESNQLVARRRSMRILKLVGQEDEGVNSSSSILLRDGSSRQSHPPVDDDTTSSSSIPSDDNVSLLPNYFLAG